MDAVKMLQKVQELKEQTILNRYEKPEEVDVFFNEHWAQILDILDDALYAYLNNENE